MIFVNYNHQQNFNVLIEGVPSHVRNSKEKMVLIYLIAGNEELKEKLTPYIDWSVGVDFQAFFSNEDLSSGLFILAKLAWVLYNNGSSLNFSEVFVKLDTQNLELAINAARYRYSKNGDNHYQINDTNSYLK